MKPHDVIGGSWTHRFDDAGAFTGASTPFLDCLASFGSNSLTIFQPLSRRLVTCGDLCLSLLGPCVLGAMSDPSSQNVIQVPLP